MTDRPQIDQALNILRIIVLAMMIGVLGFSVVACVVAKQGPPNPGISNALVLALAGLGVGELMAYLVIRPSLLREVKIRFEQRPHGDEVLVALLPAFQTLTIITCALVEAFGLFGAIVVLITGRWVALAAPAISLVLLAAQLPSRDRLSRLATQVSAAQWR